MTRFVIVPNELRDAIHAAIDRALLGRPCDELSRDTLYHDLLAYFDLHGQLPEFTLEPK